MELLEFAKRLRKQSAQRGLTSASSFGAKTLAGMGLFLLAAVLPLRADIIVSVTFDPTTTGTAFLMDRITFRNEIFIQPGNDWEFQIALTGPALDQPTPVLVRSSTDLVPIDHFQGLLVTEETVFFNRTETANIFQAPRTLSDISDVIATITAVGKRVTRTATVRVARPR
jgi:hypothetical protein